MQRIGGGVSRARQWHREHAADQGGSRSLPKGCWCGGGGSARIIVGCAVADGWCEIVAAIYHLLRGDRARPRSDLIGVAARRAMRHRRRMLRTSDRDDRGWEWERMARALVMWREGETPAERARPAPLSRRADFGTILCGQWLMMGLAIDGWAHHTRPNVESFFTPWHALLYSGYAACAAWMLWLIAEQRRAGRSGRAAIPRGYESGVAGVILFGLAGIGDLIWHEMIGIEQNRKASLSPSHLLLFVGILLIVSSPFRAAWAADDSPHARPRMVDFLPALLSLSGAAAIAGAMHIWLWAFAYLADGRPLSAALPAAALAPTADLNLAMILISTILLLAPLLLLLRRWHPPFGSATILFGVVAGLLCAVTGFRQPLDVLVAVATGLCTDLAIGRIDPRPGRPWAFRGVACGVPIVLWALHFAQVGLREGIAWPPEYWTGITLLSGLLGLGLSVLLLPPAIPAHARDH